MGSEKERRPPPMPGEDGGSGGMGGLVAIDQREEVGDIPKTRKRGKKAPESGGTRSATIKRSKRAVTKGSSSPTASTDTVVSLSFSLFFSLTSLCLVTHSNYCIPRNVINVKLYQH